MNAARDEHPIPDDATPDAVESPIVPVEPDNWAWALAVLVELRDTVASAEAELAAVKADNWRRIAEKAARAAPPEIWLPLKPAAVDAGVEYETARAWCERGVTVAEKRGGRWFIRMDSLRAHVAALRGK